MGTVQKRRSTPAAGKSRRTQNRKKTNYWWLAVRLFLAGLLLLAFFFLVVYLGFLGKVPSTEELNRIKTPLATEVFSADGKILGRYYVENRSNVRFKEISPNVVNALIATEDARFYEHRGIDEMALLRVFVKTILMQDRSAGGGSTLSQQIAKNLFPRNNLGVFSVPVNKLREAIIAYRLERIYSKEEILTLYLNTVPFGENIFGIEVAAERFFSKTPANLTVPEAAVLIGILKANNSYNPRLHPEQSKQRRNVVIDQMVKYGFLKAEEGEKHKAAPLNMHYRLITYNQGPAPYVLEQLRPVLTDWCKSNSKPNGDPWNLYTDGLKIYTTVDYNLQQYANYSVQEYMKSLQQVFDKHWEGRNPWGNDQSVVTRAMKLSDRYRRARAAGKNEKEIQAEFDQPAERTLFTWDGLVQKKITPLDSVKHYLKLLNTGFLALEAHTGAVKAWVGGIDFRFFQYDHVNAPRQVGSTFKPVVYLAGLENGLSPFDYFSNEKKVYKDYQNWSPVNSHDDYNGYYSMKGALSESLNTVAVEMIMQTGIGNTIETARKLGIKAELPQYPSLALGAASIPLKEMVSAYSAIVNGGRKVTPFLLVKIEDNEGNVLATFKEPRSEDPEISAENCRIIVEMLRSVTDEGTGRAIRAVYGVPGEFAGKTGTTQDQADGWFIGFNPTLVAGCWVGADDPAVHFRTITYGQGAYMALPIVGKFFSKLYADRRFAEMKYQLFDQPDPETLAQLNELPPYKEFIEQDRDFDFFNIFRKREKPADREKAKVQEPEKAAGSQEVPVWQKIKDIFKKKER